MSDHLCLIEWPQRVSAYLPASCLHLGFDISAGDQRQITITGNSEWAARLAGISIGEDRQ
jgi:tRNA A37 threonylcarbamoyladenosine biosynthesis protein TsaE